MDENPNILAYVDAIVLISHSQGNINNVLSVLFLNDVLRHEINLKKFNSLSMNFTESKLNIQQNNHVINYVVIKSMTYHDTFNYLNESIVLRISSLS